jgi:hypothetical protein
MFDAKTIEDKYMLVFLRPNRRSRLWLALRLACKRLLNWDFPLFGYRVCDNELQNWRTKVATDKNVGFMVSKDGSFTHLQFNGSDWVRDDSVLFFRKASAVSIEYMKTNVK